MKDESTRIRHASRAGWVIAIVILSTMVAMTVSWRAPGLNLYARDRLTQARGPTPAPEDIVIVAIDEASIARYGRFPWRRGLTARVLDSISSAQPKAIALDVLYSEPTDNAEDVALTDSIKRTGNTTVGAQLIETADERGVPVASWLYPLPVVESAAAGVGHVNVSTETNGEAHELPLRKADSQGRALWSIAVETIRVGEGIRASSVRDVPGGIQLGPRLVPISHDVSTLRTELRNSTGQVETSRADRMAIYYVGPPGSFSHQTFSFADVLDGRVSPQSFRGKYVLIGATAATLGDHVSTPFTHAEGPGGEEHGELMPGVEVLANAMNTILRGHFYREFPDWLAAILAALIAAAVVGLLAIAQGRRESAKQIAALIGFVALILVVSYVAFVRWLIVPPVVPALVSFAVAAPLALLRRSLRTSVDLDTRIGELTSANELLLFSAPERGLVNSLSSDPAKLIAQLSGSQMAAIYYRDIKSDNGYRVVASHGTIAASDLNDKETLSAISLDQLADTLTASVPDESLQTNFGHRPARLALRLSEDRPAAGVLIIGNPPAQIGLETLRLCAEIATGYIARFDEETARQPTSLPALPWLRLPRGVEWKADALGVLNRKMLARARFVDRALRAVDDGLIVADISGRIAFANPRAAEILDTPERLLMGSDLFQQLRGAENLPTAENGKVDSGIRETLMRLIIGRAPVEREISIGSAPSRYYMLRLSAVTSGDDGSGEILGLVAALSNVTEHHELQEMKTDVMTLVTHELLTPLTAIQGMSEVLAQFNVDEERRRQMHLTINVEAKRLSHMIREYLDISRLESGGHPLRLAPVRIAAVIDRVLLMLDPLAAQRNIRIVRHLPPDLPVLLAESDLITRALTNLIANAIKYSGGDAEMSVAARPAGDALIIEVRDQGYGIPAEALPRIFEKFYRVPRVEDADVPGTGLGLALVREIVELHGGRIAVESEVGIGSTFSIRLPLHAKEG